MCIDSQSDANRGRPGISRAAQHGDPGQGAYADAAIAQMAAGLIQDMLSEKPPDDGHRQNILSRSFTHIGIAIYRDTSGTVCTTQDFSN